MKLFWMNMTGEPERYMCMWLSGKSKSVKINPGKEKCVVYKIKGRATWPGVEDKKIRMKFKCLKITIKHKMNYAASPFWMFFL